VDERKKGADHRENCGRNHEDPAWADQCAEINGEGANEHQGDVVGAADPRAVVETDSDVALEIRQTERQHTAGERYNTGAHDDTQDAEQRAL
jgi:hypothetical protein